jgi:hypothetical protein
LEEGGGRHEGEAVEISVFAPNAKTSVFPGAFFPGEVGEVRVTPSQASSGRNLSVIIAGRRSKLRKVKVTIEVGN